MRLSASARFSLPAVAPTLLAAGLLVSPTWGALDYHASLALAPAVGLCALQLAATGRDSVQTLIGLVLAPLATLLLGALWVPNCNILYGLGFYLLGPAMSLPVGLGWGRLGRSLAPQSPVALAWTLALASTLPPLWHFLLHPQVFAFHGLVGYVAGALYEDAVALSWPYLTFRVIDLALWLPLLAVLARLPTSGRLSWLRRQRWLVPWLAVEGAALGIAVLAAGAAQWRVATADVAAALPLRDVLTAAETAWQPPPDPQRPALVLHLPATPSARRALPALRADAAFRYAELSRQFGVAPQRTIHLYLYADAGEKQRWMGASRVDMAKPWLRQVHMVLPEFGSSVLKHELAHVFAAEWAASPLGIPLRNQMIPDAMLIEGLAVAMEWPLRAGLDPHQWTRAMRAAGLAPSLLQLWSLTGFLGQSSDRAYTVAGSFLRWLLTTRGPEPVRRLYAGEPLARVTAKSLPELTAEWEAFVDDPRLHPLTAEDRARAELRFSRPGLFEKPCALEVGRCSAAADRAAEAGRPAVAAQTRADLLSRVAAHVALGRDDPELHLAYADDLARLARLTEAEAELSALSARAGAERIHPLLRAVVTAALGDVAWRRGGVAAARDAWRAAARAPVSEAMRRTLEVKQHFAGAPGAAEAMDRLWTLGGWRAAGGVGGAIARLRAALPDDPVAAAIAARRQMAAGQRRAGCAALAASVWPLLATAPWSAVEATRQLALNAAFAPTCRPPWWALGLAEAMTPPPIAEEWRLRLAFSERQETGATRSEPPAELNQNPEDD